MASSIGHLMKTAKDSSVEKLFAKLRTWYMTKSEDQDPSAKWSVAYTFQAITRHNPDRMKAHATEAMPLAFLAMHEAKTETNSEILEVWDEVWTDGTPGTESGIRLYLKEIVSLLSAALGTIHILCKHFYSTKLNLNAKFYTKTGFFCQNKRISFSTLHFDEIFKL